MRLFLSIETQVLDSILLDPEKVKEDGYVKSLCRLLIIKHELTIIAHLKKPFFYIQVASDFESHRSDK